jgi:hypothetical protein
MSPSGRATNLIQDAGRSCRVARPTVSPCFDPATLGGPDTFSTLVLRLIPDDVMKGEGRGVTLVPPLLPRRVRVVHVEMTMDESCRAAPHPATGTERGCRDVGRALLAWQSVAKPARRSSR